MPFCLIYFKVLFPFILSDYYMFKLIVSNIVFNIFLYIKHDVFLYRVLLKVAKNKARMIRIFLKLKDRILSDVHKMIFHY